MSGLAGWVMLSAVVLAAPDMSAAAAAGEHSFIWILREATPRWTHGLLYTAIAAAQYFCGLACITSTSRLIWAMARDNGLPCAHALSRIGAHQTPSVAIWTTCIAAAALPLVIAYETIASVCAVFFYIAYVVPTACGLVTFGRWPRLGPWHLGPWYPPLAVVCVLGCGFLLVLGVQPPNQIALWVIPGVTAVLFALWFGYFRLHFRDEVTRALRKLAAFQAYKKLKVTPLGGGETNRNYRVEIDGETYVLRIAGAETGKLLIDRPRELVAARAAAAAGIAPGVVDHLDDHTVLVTRFVHGKPLKPEDARQAEVMRRVALALRTYHDHPVPPALGPFSPFDTVRYYYLQAREKNVALPGELHRAIETLSRIEDELRAEEPHCLCHNDLLLGNFIDAGHALVIIDWEYAGLGDRYFDLGNFAAHNQLDEAGEQLLLEHYFGEARPEDLRRLQLMRLLSDLREATWGYLQSAISGLNSPQHYLDRGREFLDRFLAAPVAKELMAT
jgi:thiamine kinase-like enzyme